MNEVFFKVIVMFMGSVNASQLDFVSTQTYADLEQCEVVAAIVQRRFNEKSIVFKGETVSIEHAHCIPELPLRGF